METFEAAVQIHGDSADSTIPAEVGLIDISPQRCHNNVLVEAISKTKK
jgi:hypothetical protein